MAVLTSNDRCYRCIKRIKAECSDRSLQRLRSCMALFSIYLQLPMYDFPPFLKGLVSFLPETGVKHIYTTANGLLSNQ